MLQCGPGLESATQAAAVAPAGCAEALADMESWARAAAKELGPKSLLEQRGRPQKRRKVLLTSSAAVACANAANADDASSPPKRASTRQVERLSSLASSTHCVLDTVLFGDAPVESAADAAAVAHTRLRRAWHALLGPTMGMCAAAGFRTQGSVGGASSLAYTGAGSAEWLQSK